MCPGQLLLGHPKGAGPSLPIAILPRASAPFASLPLFHFSAAALLLSHPHDGQSVQHIKWPFSSAGINYSTKAAPQIKGEPLVNLYDVDMEKSHVRERIQNPKVSCLSDIHGCSSTDFLNNLLVFFCLLSVSQTQTSKKLATRKPEV